MPYKDKEKRKEWNRNRKRKNRKEVHDLKNKPCMDCGHSFPPYVMEFDHVPERGKKLFNIATLGNKLIFNLFSYKLSYQVRFSLCKLS